MIALLAGTFCFLGSRHDNAELSAINISLLPKQSGAWTGEDLSISPEIREILGPGQYLSRRYLSSSSAAPIDVFIAYLPSQRSGAAIHSPKNCLPGSGWTPVESGRLRIGEGDASSIEVNRYLVARGGEKDLVLYWYQSHSRVVASEYAAKFYLIKDAIELNRTDGAMVRIITPLMRSEPEAQAEQRAVFFSQHLLPLLNRYLPS